nr:hypothetical protein [Tanacetum cinerariifolium]
MFEYVTQKTYAYAEVRAQNQDLLMTISELKSKLKTIDNGKHVNTKFDKSETVGQLLCVTPFNKNIAIKTKNVSNTKATSDRSNPVTSRSTSTIEKKQQHNANIIARGMYNQEDTKTSNSKTNTNFSNSTGAGSSNSVIQLVLWIVDSGCSKHMAKNLQLLRNFVEKFIGTVRFGNDHFTAITCYRDYVQGNLTICHVYYVEGLEHNMFLARQFCDGDLEVAFRSNTCYVQDLEGDDLLMGSRDSNLYTIYISKMSASSSGKSRKASLSPKLVPSTESKFELLHMDLCRPIRVAIINGQKYILVIVDDYSRFTWVYFLRTKDGAPDMIIDFVNQVQRNLKASILMIRTDNETEFINEKLRLFFSKLVIVHKTLIAQMPQQNGVLERRNRTLIEAAQTMLIFSKAPVFLWAEAIATACFTQNRSIVHTRHNKTPYELIRGRKPNVKHFHVFGSLCYLKNDHDGLGKMKPKADIGTFVAYFESSHGFRTYKRRTKKIMETIHIKFDELTSMASECDNLELEMNCANFNDSSED